MIHYFRGIRPDDRHGRMGLRNPERGLRTEMYFSTIPGEVAGVCSCHSKLLKLDGRPTAPVYQNETIPGVPHLIRGNRLDGVEFSHGQWMDELDYFAYDGVTIMQSYCFLMKYGRGEALPPEKLADIEEFFLKLRQCKVKALLRFAYELSPTLYGPSAETTLKHLEQLRPLIQKYRDVIYVLQCGFVGKFGEWHNSYNYLQLDLGFRRELMSQVLKVLPPERRTMMRYPLLKQELYGVEPLDEAHAFTADPRARIGHFCDGFMAHVPSHGGTYGRGGEDKVDSEISYVAQESQFLPQDGELFWRDVGGAALPTASVLALRDWHFDTLGMVHSNGDFEGVPDYSIDVWKKVPVDPMFLEANKLPMSDHYFEDERGAFVWRSYYEYIRDHIGYRIELQSFEYENISGGVKGKLKLINRGFSAPVNPRPVYLVLGAKYVPLKCQVQKWYSLQEQCLEFEAALPPGRYAAGLALPDGTDILAADPEFAIRCANALEFRDGVNEFGFEVEVK